MNPNLPTCILALLHTLQNCTLYKHIATTNNGHQIWTISDPYGQLGQLTLYSNITEDGPESIVDITNTGHHHLQRIHPIEHMRFTQTPIDETITRYEIELHDNVTLTVLLDDDFIGTHQMLAQLYIQRVFHTTRRTHAHTGTRYHDDYLDQPPHPYRESTWKPVDLHALLREPEKD